MAAPRKIPPCPDPENYQLVKRGKTYYWRRKRGSIKKATLNASFQENAKLLSICSPAAKRIKEVLFPYLTQLKFGSLAATMSSLLANQVKQEGKMGYDFFMGLDIQKKYPLDQILTTPWILKVEEGILSLQLELKPYSVKQHSKLVSDFVLELIFVFGDPGLADGLSVFSEPSELFSFAEKVERAIVFSMALPPTKPWMLLLKLSCFEGNQQAVHPRHYGMKVVAVG
jgi:hypothetical protein